MKDQSPVGEETTLEKWDRARSLMLESLYKADNHLRSCSHNQKCYDELMEIREQVIELVRDMPNPHALPIKIPFGQKNDHIEPTITTPHGEISETLMSGALGDYYADKREY
tara:strand:+ start:95 stop:427 length:333 start_codon:yes stop_codon:yes gene_type:complete